MNKDSKIYVAGHRGLVGSALVRKLKDCGYKNVVFRTSRELDLRNQHDTELFFKTERPEVVFLAAAKVGGIVANNTYKAEFIYDNLMISANVIEASYRHEVKKLLNLGSSCIYPRLAPQPLKEEYILSGNLEPTNEPYAIAKIAAVKLCRYYNEQYGTDFLSVMPTNLYGPGDNFNLERSHVLPALIRKFHLAKLVGNKKWDDIRTDIEKYDVGFGLKVSDKLDNQQMQELLRKIGVTSESVELWGTGEPIREFLHVDDLAHAALTIMERYSSADIGEIVNIGSGKEIRIKDLAYLVCSIVGFRGEVKFDSSKPDGTPWKVLDISKASSLGWKSTITIEEGIKKTYDWYLQSDSRRTVG